MKLPTHQTVLPTVVIPAGNTTEVDIARVRLLSLTAGALAGVRAEGVRIMHSGLRHVHQHAFR